MRTAAAAATVDDSVLKAVVAGAAIGLALGVALALLLEALDRRVRSAAEVARRLGAPLLGRLPSPRRRRGRPAGLVMFEQDASPEAESYRVARVNLEHAIEDRAPSVMVSAVEGQFDQSPMVTANLALALARGSRHTILIDLDLRQAPMDALFGTGQRRGLTDVVSGASDLESTLVTVWRGDASIDPASEGLVGEAAASAAVLELLPAGTQPTSVGELLASARLHEVVQGLRDHGDLVVIHGPPLLGTADALAVLGAVGGVVVVAGVGVVGRDVLADVHEELDGVAETLGVLVTGIGRSAAGSRPRTRRYRPWRIPTLRRSSRNGYRTPASVQARARR